MIRLGHLVRRDAVYELHSREELFAYQYVGTVSPRKLVT